MTPTPPESPDQGPEHNPDGLTPEQYGAPEWRLLRVGEITEDGDQCDVSPDGTDWRVQLDGLEIIPEFRCTYRRRVAPEPEQARNNTLNKLAYEQSGEPRTECPTCAGMNGESAESSRILRERDEEVARLKKHVSQLEGDFDAQTIKLSNLSVDHIPYTIACPEALALLRHLEDGHEKCGCDIAARISRVKQLLEACRP